MVARRAENTWSSRMRLFAGLSALESPGAHGLRGGPAGAAAAAAGRRLGHPRPRAGRRQRRRDPALRRRVRFPARSSRSRARRPCGARRCCAPAWARISACSLIEGLGARARWMRWRCRSSRPVRTRASCCTGNACPGPVPGRWATKGRASARSSRRGRRLAVRIVQPGGEESLNVASAAAICLHASAAAQAAMSALQCPMRGHGNAGRSAIIKGFPANPYA